MLISLRQSSSKIKEKERQVCIVVTTSLEGERERRTGNSRDLDFVVTLCIN
jgi:hypothetical protein